MNENKLRLGIDSPAFNNTTKVANSDSADAAQRVRVFQSQFDEQELNEPNTTKEELWAIIFPLSILLSLGSAPWLVRTFFILGLGGWVLKGIEVLLGSTIEIYLFVHPLLAILCPIISWHLHKKNKHTKAIVWTIIPIVGFIVVAVLYYIISVQHPAWG
jgi:hypothetical protein